ncbi:hypothetical protein [uncultured Ruminococcus sp.]|uniref:hypothetical protein n=1 Tax=uncultured Ruminococcus sp. TaxID=165186 RepID=UPI002618D866|nr:hypothetical protein [uncultured Ruminococcus sp.]
MDKLLKNKLVACIAWNAMALLAISMQTTDTLEAFLNDNVDFVHHLGMKGIWIFAIMIMVNIIMQFVIAAFDSLKTRIVSLGVTAFYTVFMIIHQVTHLISGDRFDIHFCFDLLHHTFGIIAIIAIYKQIQICKSKKAE